MSLNSSCEVRVLGPRQLSVTPAPLKRKDSGLPAGPTTLTATGGLDHIISLSIGGEPYQEKMSILLAEPESLLSIMVREKCCEHSATSEPSSYCVGFEGRSGRMFQFILNYLRHGQRAILPSKPEDLKVLLLEAEFFQLYGLVSLIWCILAKIRLEVFSLLKVGVEVMWNPGVVELFWQGVACMSRCYYTHRTVHRFLVVGMLRAKTQFGCEGPWWCYDVVCPGCQTFDFAPVDDGVDFEKLEVPIKEKMKEISGKILKIVEGGSCAQVEFATSEKWKFHIPIRALLPASYATYRAPSR